MMEEILNTSKLSDTRRLGEIIGEIRSRGQASLIGAGHQTAVLRSAAYGSPMAEYQDEMAGVGYYKFIEDLEKNFSGEKGRDRSRTSECHGRDHPKGFLHGKLYRRKRVCGTGEGLKRCPEGESAGEYL